MAPVSHHGGPIPGNSESRAVEGLTEKRPASEQADELLRPQVTRDMASEPPEPDSLSSGEDHRPEPRLTLLVPVRGLGPCGDANTVMVT